MTELLRLLTLFEGMHNYHPYLSDSKVKKKNLRDSGVSIQSSEAP